MTFKILIQIPGSYRPSWLLLASMVVNIPSLTGLASADPPPWTSPNRYHLSLSVDPKGVARSNSPASVDIDFVQALADLGESGTFDEHTIEIIAYNASNEMVIFDTSR
ncbi:MAG: hypothetical protein ACYTF1_01295, partial [Planctomycetota bacterium]